MEVFTKIILPAITLLLTAGNITQFLFYRALKRTKNSEADLKEIGTLKAIIESNQAEIIRLKNDYIELNKEYKKIQQEFFTIQDDFRKRYDALNDKYLQLYNKVQI